MGGGRTCLLPQGGDAERGLRPGLGAGCCGTSGSSLIPPPAEVWGHKSLKRCWVYLRLAPGQRALGQVKHLNFVPQRIPRQGKHRLHAAAGLRGFKQFHRPRWHLGCLRSNVLKCRGGQGARDCQAQQALLAGKAWGKCSEMQGNPDKMRIVHCKGTLPKTNKPTPPHSKGKGRAPPVQTEPILTNCRSPVPPAAAGLARGAWAASPCPGGTDQHPNCKHVSKYLPAQL